VEAFRGDRDYLRAADLLAVAPLEPRPSSVRFFMHKLAVNPGEWRKDFTGLAPSHREESVADLKLAFADRIEQWSFVVDVARPIERRVAEVDRAALAAGTIVSNGRSFVTMSDAFNIWEYIIASGRRFSPGREWLFAYFLARFDLFPKTTSGHILEAGIGRRRGGFIELELAIDGHRVGAVGVCRREL
jgi:hypothetical protein